MMKLDQVLNRIHARTDEFVDQIKTELNSQTPEDTNIPTDEPRAHNSSIVPMDLAAQGLMAVGGCRKCSRTFTTRLSLISHFVDHFPSIFYTFEQPSQTIEMTDDSRPATSQSSFFAQLADILEEKQNDFFHSPNEHKSAVHLKSSESKAQKPARISSLPRRIESTNQFDIRTAYPGSTSKTNDDDAFQYHMCPKCYLTFSETQSFENHLLTHVAEKSRTSSTTCEQCGIQLCTSLLAEHQKSHTKTCFICAANFTTLFDFNLHIGEHLDFVYSCKDCGRCFPTRKMLAEHNQIHRIVSPENCLSNVEKSETIQLPKHGKRSIAENFRCADRPPSLLRSNPYFNNELVKDVVRRRRSRASKAARTNWSRIKFTHLLDVQSPDPNCKQPVKPSSLNDDMPIDTPTTSTTSANL